MLTFLAEIESGGLVFLLRGEEVASELSIFTQTSGNPMGCATRLLLLTTLSRLDAAFSHEIRREYVKEEKDHGEKILVHVPWQALSQNILNLLRNSWAEP